MAYRSCGEDSNWFDPDFGGAHTRYNHCPDVDAFKVRQSSAQPIDVKYFSTLTFFFLLFSSVKWHDAIIKIQLAGYSISLLFLFIATFIFLYFRYGKLFS